MGRLARQAPATEGAPSEVAELHEAAREPESEPAAEAAEATREVGDTKTVDALDGKPVQEVLAGSVETGDGKTLDVVVRDREGEKALRLVDPIVEAEREVGATKVGLVGAAYDSTAKIAVSVTGVKGEAKKAALAELEGLKPGMIVDIIGTDDPDAAITTALHEKAKVIVLAGSDREPRTGKSKTETADLRSPSWTAVEVDNQRIEDLQDKLEIFTEKQAQANRDVRSFGPDSGSDRDRKAFSESYANWDEGKKEDWEKAVHKVVALDRAVYETRVALNPYMSDAEKSKIADEIEGVVEIVPDELYAKGYETVKEHVDLLEAKLRKLEKRKPSGMRSENQKAEATYNQVLTEYRRHAGMASLMKREYDLANIDKKIDAMVAEATTKRTKKVATGTKIYDAAITEMGSVTDLQEEARRLRKEKEALEAVGLDLAFDPDKEILKTQDKFYHALVADYQKDPGRIRNYVETALANPSTPDKTRDVMLVFRADMIRAGEERDAKPAAPKATKGKAEATPVVEPVGKEVPAKKVAPKVDAVPVAAAVDATPTADATPAVAAAPEASKPKKADAPAAASGGEPVPSAAPDAGVPVEPAKAETSAEFDARYKQIQQYLKDQFELNPEALLKKMDEVENDLNSPPADRKATEDFRRDVVTPLIDAEFDYLMKKEEKNPEGLAAYMDAALKSPETHPAIRSAIEQFRNIRAYEKANLASSLLLPNDTDTNSRLQAVLYETLVDKYKTEPDTVVQHVDAMLADPSLTPANREVMESVKEDITRWTLAAEKKATAEKPVETKIPTFAIGTNVKVKIKDRTFRNFGGTNVKVKRLAQEGWSVIGVPDSGGSHNYYTLKNGDKVMTATVDMLILDNAATEAKKSETRKGPGVDLSAEKSAREAAAAETAKAEAEKLKAKEPEPLLPREFTKGDKVKLPTGKDGAMEDWEIFAPPPSITGAKIDAFDLKKVGVKKRKGDKRGVPLSELQLHNPPVPKTPETAAGSPDTAAETPSWLAGKSREQILKERGDLIMGRFDAFGDILLARVFTKDLEFVNKKITEAEKKSAGSATTEDKEEQNRRQQMLDLIPPEAQPTPEDMALEARFEAARDVFSRKSKRLKPKSKEYLALQEEFFKVRDEYYQSQAEKILTVATALNIPSVDGYIGKNLKSGDRVYTTTRSEVAEDGTRTSVVDAWKVLFVTDYTTAGGEPKVILEKIGGHEKKPVELSQFRRKFGSSEEIHNWTKGTNLVVENDPTDNRNAVPLSENEKGMTDLIQSELLREGGDLRALETSFTETIAAILAAGKKPENEGLPVDFKEALKANSKRTLWQKMRGKPSDRVALIKKMEQLHFEYIEKKAAA